MLHWRHTTLDVLFVLPQNHGSWKFENGYTSSKAYSLINFQLGGTEILFDEVELQRVTA